MNFVIKNKKTKKKKIMTYGPCRIWTPDLSYATAGSDPVRSKTL